MIGRISVYSGGLRGLMLCKYMASGSLTRESYRLSIIPTVLFAVSLGTVCACDDPVTKPKFRSGLWRFERTLEYVRRPPNENLVL